MENLYLSVPVEDIVYSLDIEYRYITFANAYIPMMDVPIIITKVMLQPIA